MKVAFQMDPLGPVDIAADSTFRLAEEAQARGHSLYYYTPDKLAYDRGRIVARGHELSVQRVQGDHFKLGEEQVLDLAELDVIWLRQDPPFDMFYITTTHLLERLRDTTLVLNDPFWVRNFPEKLMLLDFPDLMPATAIARDLQTIKEFKDEFGDVIVKPLYGNGGAGVFLLRKEDRNLSSLHEMFTGFSREPLIVQQYLPQISQGDKRVILVDGEPVGAINRMPAAGETRSNMHVGGRPEPCELTDRDREICSIIGPKLRDHDQVFVGIDVIGTYLTEINVTSPTGIQELERFDGVNVAQRIWEVTEARRA